MESGKTTPLRLLTGELEPSAGTIKKAASLKIVYFSQTRELEEGVTAGGRWLRIRTRWCTRGAWCMWRAYATKFLFTSEQLESASAETAERRRRGCAGAYCEVDAGASGCIAAGRADERSGHCDAGNIWKKVCWSTRGRAGTGDARSVHAGSGVDDSAGAGWAGQLPETLRGLFGQWEHVAARAGCERPRFGSSNEMLRLRQ